MTGCAPRRRRASARPEGSVRALVVTRYSPQHTRLRKLVVQALTSRAVEGMHLPVWSGKGSDG